MKRFITTVLAGATLALLGISSAQADYLIAVAGPMTGQYASFGEQMRRGAEMAVKDINATGGLLGQKLVLTIGDDACDPKQAVAVANKFASQGVVFVAGHFCSGSSIPASKVYYEEHRAEQCHLLATRARAFLRGPRARLAGVARLAHRYPFAIGRAHQQRPSFLGRRYRLLLPEGIYLPDRLALAAL